MCSRNTPYLLVPFIRPILLHYFPQTTKSVSAKLKYFPPHEVYSFRVNSQPAIRFANIFAASNWQHPLRESCSTIPVAADSHFDTPNVKPFTHQHKSCAPRYDLIDWSRSDLRATSLRYLSTTPFTGNPSILYT